MHIWAAKTRTGGLLSNIQLQAKVSDFIENKEWNLPEYFIKLSRASMLNLLFIHVLRLSYGVNYKV